jgi:PAS domain S-box-containing protein
MGNGASSNGAAARAELSLRLPEQKWASDETSAHLLLEGVRNCAIYMLDRTGRIVSWNVGAELIKGYRATEVLGKHFSIFYLPEEQGEPLRLLLAAVDGPVEDEGWRVRKGGSPFWANVVITPVRDSSGWLVAFAAVTRVLSDREEQEDIRVHIQALRSTVDTLSGESASANLKVLQWALDRVAGSVKEALKVATEASAMRSDEHKR